MVKENVTFAMMPRDEMEEILARYGVKGLQDYSQLFGGYSGSNYKIEAEGGASSPNKFSPGTFTACLKVCNGYTKEEVEEQAGVQAYLSLVGFEGACVALPLLSGGYVSFARDGKPCIMLSFVQGKAGDSVVESGVDGCHVIKGVGTNLARLHAVEIKEIAAAPLRTYEQGGCCLLGYHASGAYWEKVK